MNAALRVVHQLSSDVCSILSAFYLHSEHTHTHSLVSKAQTPAVRCGGVSWGFLGLFC